MLYQAPRVRKKALVPDAAPPALFLSQHTTFHEKWNFSTNRPFPFGLQPNRINGPLFHNARIDVEPPDLSGQVSLAENTYFSVFGDAYGDIWQGKWQEGDQMRYVAVRIPRLRPDKHGFQGVSSIRQPNAETGVLPLYTQRYLREIEVWKGLHHANIAPLLGTITKFGPHASTGMVFPWLDNGNLNTFLETECHSAADRFQILFGVAAGLTYLHNKEIVHGDLTGTNIFVDKHRNAYLIGFGLSSVEVEFEGTSTVGGAMRWRAPELLPLVKGDLYGYTPTLTSACDIYSFGSVTLQILSGKVPYHDVKPDICVLLAIANGIQPRRPQLLDFTDDYWDFIKHCWGDTPAARPNIGKVHSDLLDLRETALNRLRDHDPTLPT